MSSMPVARTIAYNRSATTLKQTAEAFNTMARQSSQGIPIDGLDALKVGLQLFQKIAPFYCEHPSCPPAVADTLACIITEISQHLSIGEELRNAERIAHKNMALHLLQSLLEARSQPARVLEMPTNNVSVGGASIPIAAAPASNF